MKRLIFILFVMAATMIFFNCSENNSTAPDLAQDNQVTLAKSKTSFMGTAVVFCPPSPPYLISPGTTKILPNGKKLIRGIKVKFDMVANEPNGLLDGEMFWTTNKNVEADGIKAKLWGKIELIVAGGKGKWELTWHGYKTGLDVVIDANGVGVEGDVKGMVTKMTMEMELILKENPDGTLILNPEGKPIVDHCAKVFDTIEGYILK